MTDKTTIELNPNHTALVFDEEGNMIEVYMPDRNGDEIVPDRIVRVLAAALADKPNVNENKE